MKGHSIRTKNHVFEKDNITTLQSKGKSNIDKNYFKKHYNTSANRVLFFLSLSMTIQVGEADFRTSGVYEYISFLHFKPILLKILKLFKSYSLDLIGSASNKVNRE